MTRIKIAALVSVFAITLSACTSNYSEMQGPSFIYTTTPPDVKTVEKFSIGASSLVVDIPSNWERIDPHEDRIRITDGSAEMQLHYYNSLDFTVDFTSHDLYEDLVETVMALCKNVEIVEAEEVTGFDDKTITSQLYSGESYDLKFYNYFCLVEFENTSEFAFVVCYSTPSYALSHMDEWNDIIDSIKNKPIE